MPRIFSPISKSFRADAKPTLNMRNSTILLVASLAFMAVAGGLLLQRGGPQPQDFPPPREIAVPDYRPSFSLPDLSGRTRRIDEWDGSVVVVNFWATWCAPCRKEIPEFVALQEKYGAAGLQFVGVALDEAEQIKPFAESFGINYPILVGTLDALEIGRDYGNGRGGLPYTVVVDREGRVLYHKVGRVTTAELMENAVKIL